MEMGKWEVVYGDEFKVWLYEQEKGLQEEIFSKVEILTTWGPTLTRPHSDTLKNSKLANLKELRIKYNRAQWRVLYVFDPIRRAILLLGGNKTGISNWYEKNIPLAEERYAHHLKKMEQEHGNHA